MSAAAIAAEQREVPDEDLVKLSAEFDQQCRELMVPEEVICSQRQMRQVRPADLQGCLEVHEECDCQVSDCTIFNECLRRGMEMDDLLAEFGSDVCEMIGTTSIN